MVQWIVWPFLVVSCATFSQPPPAVPPGYARIDGAKTPEQIPEYVLWQTVFDNLKTLPSEWLRTQLSLSRDEEARLYAEAKLFAERQAECSKRMERMTATTPPKDQGRPFRDITLACRQADLDAADALLAQLSPETRLRVVQWAESKRVTIVLLVDKNHADIFRLPR
jgi:hypothetical protein